VRLKLHVAPGWELKSWIKGFTPHVRVLAPARLRKELVEELEQGRARLAAPAKRRR
jgi:predicted DNA-binding transcriptional regulator YafY